MMLQKSRCLSLVALLGLFQGAAVQAESLSNYAHHAAIKSEGAGPFFHLPLSMAVYRDSLSPGLRDVRVFNAAGEMVPHALTLKADSPQPKVEQIELPGFALYSDTQAASQGIQIRREKNGALVSIEPTQPTVTRKLTGVIVDASHIAAALVAIEIALPEYRQPFQRFSIEASDDLKSWRNVQDSASIAVLEQGGARIEQRRVELAAIRAKYLRLTWLDPQEISHLPKVMATVSSAPLQRQPDMLWSAAITPEQGKSGELIYRLSSTLPVERLRFLLPQINTLTPAQVRVRGDDRQPWRRLPDTVLYRLADKNTEYVSPDIDLGGESINAVQIKLDARAGGVGAAPLQVTIGVQPQQLVFLARGAGPFTLAWGMPGATTSALPLATLVPAYRYEDGVPGNLASIGAQENTPATFQANRDTKNQAMDADQKRTWLLWAVLIVGSLALMLMAWKLIRSGDNTHS